MAIKIWHMHFPFQSMSFRADDGVNTVYPSCCNHHHWLSLSPPERHRRPETENMCRLFIVFPMPFRFDATKSVVCFPFVLFFSLFFFYLAKRISAPPPNRWLPHGVLRATFRGDTYKYNIRFYANARHGRHTAWHGSAAECEMCARGRASVFPYLYSI